LNFDLSDEQKMLSEQARGLLGANSSPDRLRELILGNAEWDAPLWRQLSEMGFLGAAIPESYGGLGLGPIDLGVISESLGRANAAVPFFSSIVLSANALLLAGSEAQKASWLPRLASGETVATLAYGEPGSASTIGFSGGKLTGSIAPVADAGIASVAIVVAQDGNGPLLALVDLSAPGVTCGAGRA
jgi:acyl-CoA dehydrogenase